MGTDRQTATCMKLHELPVLNKHEKVRWYLHAVMMMLSWESEKFTFSRSAFRQADECQMFFISP